MLYASRLGSGRKPFTGSRCMSRSYYGPDGAADRKFDGDREEPKTLKPQWCRFAGNGPDDLGGLDLRCLASYVGTAFRPCKQDEVRRTMAPPTFIVAYPVGFASTSAPFSSKTRTTSTRARSAATLSGVWSLSSRPSTSAPCARSVFTTSALPSPAAWMSRSLACRIRLVHSPERLAR